MRGEEDPAQVMRRLDELAVRTARTGKVCFTAFLSPAQGQWAQASASRQRVHVTLQGGYDRARLHGVYKLMMTIMEKAAGKGLSEKENRTPEEDAMLDLMLHGGSRVSEENLEAVWEWYQMVS